MAIDTREGRSAFWDGAALVAAGLVLALLVVLTPSNDTLPKPDTNNAGPTTAPVRPSAPKTEP